MRFFYNKEALGIQLVKSYYEMLKQINLNVIILFVCCIPVALSAPIGETQTKNSQINPVKSNILEYLTVGAIAVVVIVAIVAFFVCWREKVEFEAAKDDDDTSPPFYDPPTIDWKPRKILHGKLKLVV